MVGIRALRRLTSTISTAGGTTMTTVHTLTGEVPTNALGVTYMHEHLFVMTPDMQTCWPGFGGYDEVVEVARAQDDLRRLKAEYGCDTIVDPTVGGIGRRIGPMLRAVEGTGLNVIVATGYYTFNELPLAIHRLTTAARIDLLQELFERDITEGIESTAVKAGILKFATDTPGMTEDVEAVVRAVARTHLRTGTPITTHTSYANRSGLLQQEILRDEGVDLRQVVIGHCNESNDLGYLESLMEAGSLIGFDRCGIQSLVADSAGQLDNLAELIHRGHSDQIVLSHDGICYTDWLPRSSLEERLPNYPFGYIHQGVVPGLRHRNVSDDAIGQMLVENPRNFFAGTR
jgi:phosphotriesterase-related protein